MTVLAIIVVLLVVGVRAGMLAARGGRTGGRTALLSLACTAVALACLAGTVVLVPCGLFQGDLKSAMTGRSSPFCPSFLSSGDR